MGFELNSFFLGSGGLPPDEALRLLTKTLNIGISFKNRERFCFPSAGLSPTEVMAEACPVDARPFEDVLEEISEAYLPGMNNFGSPRFLGFPDAGNSLPGIAGALLSDLLNVNLINAGFCARIATEMEVALIRWLRQIIGYTELPSPRNAAEVGGMVLLGGTMSNYTATLIARERAYPGTMSRGIQFDTSSVRVVVPEKLGHYTMLASLAWAGLGSDNVLRCPIHKFRYDRRLLRRLLLDSQAAGIKIIMLTAYAGDSRTMTIEDLREVHDEVRNIDPSIWLHCDGCHGTSLCFSDELRDKVSGIELWDSITLDPHKVLAVPYPMSVLLLRDPATSESILTASDLIMRQRHSLGQTTPVTGSKAFHSLRLWMLMKVLGRRGIGRMVEHRCARAMRFAELIKQDPMFLVLNEVQINSVMFVYVPPDLAPPLTPERVQILSALNREVYDRVVGEGEYYIHSFLAPDSLNALGAGADVELNALRYMSGNPLATDEIFMVFLKYLKSIGENCWRQMDRPQTS